MLYAVVLKEHPTIVKVGRTINWKTRRREYDCWNLADGDGVLECATFTINEEYCCLPGLEAECLGRINAPLVRGTEWFRTNIEHAKETIRQVLYDNAMSHIED